MIIDNTINKVVILSEEEFMALANREPVVDYDDDYYYDVNIDGMNFCPPSYPQYGLGNSGSVGFPTYLSAYKYMRQQSEEFELYRSRITQYRTDTEPWIKSKQWLFDKNGDIVDSTIVDHEGHWMTSTFFGRPIEKQRFKGGDIAELVIEDKVRLVLILEPMKTPAECWRLYKQYPNPVIMSKVLNHEKERYHVYDITTSEETYALPTDLGMPRFRISQEIIDNMNTIYKKFIEKTDMTINSKDKNSVDAVSDPLSKYGNNHPPYSLYQDETGKWGLVDGLGNKLPADFKKLDDNVYSCVFNEVVAFDEQEGFELQCWYDPAEVWFNFTFNNSAYPNEFGKYLWQRSEKPLSEYMEVILSIIPHENLWLIEDIFAKIELDKAYLDNFDDDEYDERISVMLKKHPELADASKTNPMLDAVMRNNNIDSDIKIALWHGKVKLDDGINIFLEDYSEGYRSRTNE